MAGAAFIALMGAQYGTALADTKNYENVMNDSEYMPAQETAPAVQSRPSTPVQQQSDTTRIQSIEPKAGNETAYRDDYRSDFTGPYIGADIGYNWGSFDVNNPGGADGDAEPDGWEGGLLAGYGYATNPRGFGGYAGLEAGYEWSGADGDLGGVSYEKNHNWLVTFRPGVTMGDGNALAYGVVGYSRAEFEANGDEDNLDGLVLGGGTEFGMWRAPIKMRLEYNYIDYEDASLSNIDFEGHENTVKTGLVFRL
jgi:outer membrane immunogenic protein